MTDSDYNDSVFINCPFDSDYKRLFDAIVFTVFDCGFIACCTLIEQDSSQVRIEKIYKIVSNCKYGINDLSRTEPDPNTDLPRFNMPFELGIFLGTKKFGGGVHVRKKCLILDREQYRYQQFISDISGQDIKSHEGDPKKAIKIVRNWLRNTSRRRLIPGGHEIWRRYQSFKEDLPAMCADLRLDPNDLIYDDYTQVVSEWLQQQ